MQDDGLHLWVAGGLCAGLQQRLAQVVAQGIDRGVAQADQGQLIVAAVVDQRHGNLLVIGLKKNEAAARSVGHRRKILTSEFGQRSLPGRLSGRRRRR
ncbi:hypothetical protein D3C81_1820250 [compost metagenome]